LAHQLKGVKIVGGIGKYHFLWSSVVVHQRIADHLPNPDGIPVKVADRRLHLLSLRRSSQQEKYE
jgi:hypothetical protein